MQLTGTDIPPRKINLGSSPAWRQRGFGSSALLLLASLVHDTRLSRLIVLAGLVASTCNIPLNHLGISVSGGLNARHSTPPFLASLIFLNL